MTQTAAHDPSAVPPHNPNTRQASRERQPISAENLAAYKKAVDETSKYVVMLGDMIGMSAIRVMREEMQPPVGTAAIWGGLRHVICPGRTRLDPNHNQENIVPIYKDGPDVPLGIGLVRIGDIHFATVDAEIFSRIGLHLKADAPANKTLIVTRASGYERSGYIYSDAASPNLTFEVLSSRLKPGCAEDKIVSTEIDLMHNSEVQLNETR